MKISPTQNRKATFIILLALLILLCFYYVANYHYHQYPLAGTISSNNYDKVVITSGTVTGTFNGGFYISPNYSTKNKRYKILSSANVSNGDSVSLLGTIDSKNQITSSKIIVVTRWSNVFVILRSFIAFLVLFYFFNRYWKFNIKEKIFKGRK